MGPRVLFAHTARMDKHYLAPLLAPQAVVVFAGRPEDPRTQTSLGRTVAAALKAQRFAGTLLFIDIQTSGTLADLAQARADLAVIALPPGDVAAALALAARIGCKAA